MDIEKLCDKYIDKPSRLRKRIDILVRLRYDDTVDRDNSRLILFGAIIISIILGAWAINIVDSWFLVCIILDAIVISLIYQYRPRYCKECSQKMIRQVCVDSMFYFCDNCKLKIKTVLGVGDAS